MVFADLFNNVSNYNRVEAGGPGFVHRYRLSASNAPGGGVRLYGTSVYKNRIGKYIINVKKY